MAMWNTALPAHLRVFRWTCACLFQNVVVIIMRSKHLMLAVPILLAATFAFADSQANWPRWRGPQDNGSNERGTYPVRWDATNNLLWKAPLPGKGCSTPIVWNNHIFLTAPVDGQDAVLAFDWSGKPLWQTAVGKEQPGKPKTSSLRRDESVFF